MSGLHKVASDEQIPRCPICGRVCVSELTRSGVKYLCPVHGEVEPVFEPASKKGGN